MNFLFFVMKLWTVAICEILRMVKWSSVEQYLDQLQPTAVIPALYFWEIRQGDVKSMGSGLV